MRRDLLAKRASVSDWIYLGGDGINHNVDGCDAGGCFIDCIMIDCIMVQILILSA